MNAEPRAADGRSLLLAWLLPPLLLGTSFALHGDVGLNLSDEGFLWHGVQRTLAGGVPLRDFQSYDPGRYLWGAAWAAIFGDGILALRLSCTVFSALGLVFGLLVARRVVPRPAWLVPIALVLALWMFPAYKPFEPALAMIAVWAGTRLLEQPTPRAHLVAGLVVGLSAFFGRNLALYSGLGIGLLALGLAWRQRPRDLSARLVAGIAGVVVGSAPLWAMLLFVPGFAESFAASLAFFLRKGANLPLPIPCVARGGRGLGDPIGHLALSFSFLYLYTVCAIGVLVALWTRPEVLERRSVLVAAATIGIFFAHHASVRADAEHLAQAIHPALLAGLALPRALRTRARESASSGAVVALLLLTIVLVPSYNHSVFLRWSAPRLVPLWVGADQLRAPPQVAADVNAIRYLVTARVPPQEPLFITQLPTLYPLLGRSPPVWWLYFLWPADPEVEEQMVRTLDEKGVDWVLSVDLAIDDRQDLRFRNSHPRVWAYLEREYEPVRERRLPPRISLLRRRGSGS